MKKTIAPIFFILIQAFLTGAQYIEMDETSVIPVNLSSSNHNRIAIIGDRVKKVFFNSSNISVEVEDNSGQLFVQLMKLHCRNTTLSLISTSGVIQDLELRFAEGPSEVILLQEEAETEELEPRNRFESPITIEEENLTSLVEGVINGTIPEGYVQFEEQESPEKIKKGLKMQRMSRLVNEKQIVFIYRLENESSQVKCVTECEVNVLDGDWVFLDRYKLKANECALVLIGCLR
jgi:hypothetical protein